LFQHVILLRSTEARVHRQLQIVGGSDFRVRKVSRNAGNNPNTMISMKRSGVPNGLYS